MKKKYFRWIWYSLLGGCVAYSIVSMALSVKKLLGSYRPMTLQGNVAYKELFNKKDTLDMRYGAIQPFTHRNPIGRVDYKGKFDLITYKIGEVKELSLKQLLIIDDKSSSPNGGIIYTRMLTSLYPFRIQEEKVGPISKLYLSIKGDSLKTIIQNDTLLSYNFKLKNFSLRYKENGDRDIVGEVEGLLAPKISYSLVIYKKRDAVYLLTMAPIDRKTVMDPMLLTHLVLNKENN